MIAITLCGKRTRPTFHAQVDGVLLESESLSRLEVLLNKLYPDEEFDWKFEAGLQWVTQHSKRGMLYGNPMVVLDDDYKAHINDLFKDSLLLTHVCIHDVHSELRGRVTRIMNRDGYTL